MRPLIDYIEPLTRFQRRQKELEIDIPFIFHAGETLGDGSKADMNLYDAILLGTKRIGHGCVVGARFVEGRADHVLPTKGFPSQSTQS